MEAAPCGLVNGPETAGEDSERVTREFCCARNARQGRGKFSLSRERRQHRGRHKRGRQGQARREGAGTPCESLTKHGAGGPLVGLAYQGFG